MASDIRWYRVPIERAPLRRLTARSDAVDPTYRYAAPLPAGSAAPVAAEEPERSPRPGLAPPRSPA